MIGAFNGCPSLRYKSVNEIMDNAFGASEQPETVESATPVPLS